MKITINGITCTYLENETILQVARKNEIHIPTLCYLKNLVNDGNCRMCLVEDENTGKLICACNTLCKDELSVLTHSEKVIKSRVNTLKLLVSNHHKNCIECAKSGACSLQSLCKEYGVDYLNNNNRWVTDNSSPCIVRNPNKCILCGRCVAVCKKTQAVNALTKIGRGGNTVVGCQFGLPLEKSPCVGCGQCVLVCPTGALVENSEIEAVKTVLKDENTLVFAQVAPSVRVSLAEYFNNPVGTFDEGRMVSALKQLGFDRVFDINVGADLTAVEESEELLERIKNHKNLPLFSSCCPAWFKYVHTFYPNHTAHLSNCKSPTEMLGAVIKNYFSSTENTSKNNIKVVGIMPCTAKKGEKLRGDDVDFVLTTRELAKMIDDAGLDYNNLEPNKFDDPFSKYSGAGLIFGATGGVTEAILRSVCRKLNPNETLVDFVDVRNSRGRKDIVVKCGKTSLSICVVNGLRNAKDVMDDIVSNKKHYDYVEVMACPGGCVNGGGQNYEDYNKIDIEDVKLKRAAALYKKDKEINNKISVESENIKNIYKNIFGSSLNKSKELLHRKNKK